MLGNACSSCRHFNAANRNSETCTAFPGGIPAVILNGRNDHRTEVDGDRDIRWAPAEGMEFMDAPQMLKPRKRL